MANDITASAILAQKAIASLTEQFPIVGLFSTNYGTELTALGQSVNVPVFGATGAVKKTGKGASIDYASEAAKNSGDWEKTTLGALVGSAKSRAVKLARQGVKSLAGSKLTWVETKTTTNNNVPSRLGEKSNPRGDHPGGRSWKITSYKATELDRDDFGNRRYTTETTWEASDAAASEEGNT